MTDMTNDRRTAKALTFRRLYGGGPLTADENRQADLYVAAGTAAHAAIEAALALPATEKLHVAVNQPAAGWPGRMSVSFPDPQQVQYRGHDDGYRGGPVPGFEDPWR